MNNPKLIEFPTPNNPFVEKILVADDGAVAILYRGASFSEKFKTRGDFISDEPTTIGPSLQIRIERD